jgi:hypothetical protein
MRKGHDGSVTWVVRERGREWGGGGEARDVPAHAYTQHVVHCHTHVPLFRTPASRHSLLSPMPNANQPVQWHCTVNVTEVEDIVNGSHHRYSASGMRVAAATGRAEASTMDGAEEGLRDLDATGVAVGVVDGLRLRDGKGARDLVLERHGSGVRTHTQLTHKAQVLQTTLDYPPH